MIKKWQLADLSVCVRSQTRCLNFRFVQNSPAEISVEILSNLTVTAGNFTEIYLEIENLKTNRRESEGNSKGIK